MCIARIPANLHTIHDNGCLIQALRGTLTDCRPTCASSGRTMIWRFIKLQSFVVTNNRNELSVVLIRFSDFTCKSVYMRQTRLINSWMGIGHTVALSSASMCARTRPHRSYPRRLSSNRFVRCECTFVACIDPRGCRGIANESSTFLVNSAVKIANYSN